MLRRPRAVAATTTATVTSVTRPFTATAHRRQQRISDYWTQHGLPGEKVGSTNVLPSFVVQAPAKPLDLERTPVDLGQGTDPRQDPLRRTLPNMELRDPISTTLRSERQRLPTAARDLAKAWLQLGTWFDGAGEGSGIVRFLQSLMLKEVPNSAQANKLLRAVTEKLIPEHAAVSQKDESLEQAQWNSLSSKFTSPALIDDLLLKPAEHFTEVLSGLVRQVENFLGQDSEHFQHMSQVAEILRRRAVSTRNAKLQSLVQVAGSIKGSKVLIDLISTIERHKKDNKLFETLVMASDFLPAAGVSTAPLESIWESGIRRSSPPSMTAVTALYLLACTSGLNPAEISPASARRVQAQAEFAAPIAVQRAFLAANASQLFRDPSKFLLAVQDTPNVPPAFARQVEMLSARSSLQRSEDVEEITPIAKLLASNQHHAEDIIMNLWRTSDIKKRLSEIVQQGNSSGSATGKNPVALPTGGGEEFGEAPILTSLRSQWKARSFEICAEILIDRTLFPHVLRTLENVRGNTASKQQAALGSSFFGEANKEALLDIERQRGARDQALHRTVQEVQRQALQSLNTDVALRILKNFGVSTDSLESIQSNATAEAEALRAKQSETFRQLLPLLRAAVAQRHVSWVAGGVLSKSANLNNEKDLALEAAKILIRLTWIPQAPRAVMDSRHRRRPGDVGLESHQTNVCVEVGQAQHYDNMEYKQYDWQGWYQRMWDIHLRNVSLRIPVKSLRRQLANDGLPILDMQGERRLRIVAGERVGGSILKLDTDRFEDKPDNLEYGVQKMQQLLSESRKAILGKEYWPSVEVKVRRPSGQTKMRYSILDWDRVETAASAQYKKYVEIKKTSVFVPPTKLWLQPSTPRKEEDIDPEQLFMSLE